MITEQIKWPIILTFTFSSSSPLLQGKQKRLQLAELISEGDCSHSSQQLDHFSGSNAFIHSVYFYIFIQHQFASKHQSTSNMGNYALTKIISECVSGIKTPTVNCFLFFCFYPSHILIHGTKRQGN